MQEDKQYQLNTLNLLLNYQPEHTRVDQYIGKLAESKHHRVSICTCSGYLPYCQVLDKLGPDSASFVTQLKITLSKTLLRPIFCFRCKNRLTTSIKPVRPLFKTHTIATLVESYVFSLLYWFNARKLQLELSKSIADGTISCFLVTQRSEISDITPTFILARFLATRRLFYRRANSLLRAGNFSSLIIFNGRMLGWRCFLNAARRLKINIIVHESGFENQTFMLKANEPAHSRSNMFDFLSENFDNLFSKNIDIAVINAWAKSFYTLRAKGENIDCLMPNFDQFRSNTIYSRELQNNSIVFYMTTPDEVDPCSDEFSLIVNQWIILPRLCRAIYEDNSHLFHKDDRLIVRLHPNFFSRGGRALANCDSKLRALKSDLKPYTNVFIDDQPHLTSPLEVFSCSRLSISFASSSVLESEHHGVPAIVPSNHIYKYGTSYNFDFSRFLSEDTSTYSFKNDPVIPTNYSKEKKNFFAYLWFNLDKIYLQANEADLSDSELSSFNNADRSFIRDLLSESAFAKLKHITAKLPIAG